MPRELNDSGNTGTAHESFLLYGRMRYLKLALLLCAASLFAYVEYDPPGGRNGGTWVGYTLGSIGALLILWLTWLGVRKRSYRSNLGTVRGWTSAHVYLGLSLLIVVTLHTGFEFGWNVHTLAYALMCLVIATGVYGIVAYSILPPRITDNRAQGTRESWLTELEELNEQSLKLADGIDPEIHRIMVRSLEGVRIGGGVMQQLFGDRPPVGQVQQLLKQTLGNLRAKSAQALNPDPMRTEMFLAGRLASAEHATQAAERVQRLLDLLARRRELVARINRDIRLQARLQIWLYLHVPLSFALLAALTAHIVSVFIYW